MSEAKAAFIEDLREKKVLARNSKYRKIGSKSKKCTTPSDYLTPAQKRKMNGAVSVYQIGKPITWSEFKLYPVEMQQKWLDAFVEKFDCSTKGMAIVFNVHPTSINLHCKNKDLKINAKGVYNNEKGEKIRAWMAEKSDEEKLNTIVDELKKIAEPKPVEEPKKVEAPVAAQTYFVNTLQNGSMRLSGTSSEIFQTLFGIFREARLSVSIDFEVLPPEPVVEEPVVEEPVAEPEPKPQDNGLPDLNTCPFDTLRALGFSVNLALNTVKNRPFKTIEDLAKVPGMTETGYKILSQKVQVL